MTAKSLMERERARLFPEQVFCNPEALARCSDLTFGQRLSALVAWRMKVAKSPGERTVLGEIDEAIEAIVAAL